MGQRAEDSVSRILEDFRGRVISKKQASSWNFRGPRLCIIPQMMLPFFPALCLFFLIKSHAVLVNDAGNACQTVDDAAASLNKADTDIKENDMVNDDMANHVVGFMLPGDENELFAFIANDYEFSRLTSQVGVMDENDIFTLGEIEIEIDLHENLSVGMAKFSLSNVMNDNGMIHYGTQSGMGTVAGDHPYGEHPSRTLFVSNINSNVEDSELRSLFEINEFQNPFRQTVGEGFNQGTLVVFNLDPSVSN